MIDIYKDSVKKQFEYYQLLGEKTFAQVTEEQLFYQLDSESNSIAMIVQHLSGNMLSRWTDFLMSDGEKTWRNREQEFQTVLKTKTELLEKWNEGWNCFYKALNELQNDDFSKIIYIRNQGQTVIEAINRQLAHYPYHIGQIVFLGKIFCKEHWKSLSIPKGNSEIYNEEKFSQEKEIKHFTEEYLPNKNKKI